MIKTQKELAFLRDLYVSDEWTRRFADMVDKHMDLTDSDNMLYINAGTGNHAITIQERFGKKTAVFASCEDEYVLSIARDKAIAVKSAVDFSMIRFEDDAFDAVLADASFVAPSGIEKFVEDTVRVARMGGDIGIYLPTSGSFGEIFSLLWEASLTDEDASRDLSVERLISDLPTVSNLEAIADRAGLVNVNTQTANELFEFENGAAFIASPLVADFLMPIWLETLEDVDRRKVAGSLARLIDDEDGEMSFVFSLKATLLTGEKG